MEQEEEGRTPGSSLEIREHEERYRFRSSSDGLPLPAESTKGKKWKIALGMGNGRMFGGGRRTGAREVISAPTGQFVVLGRSSRGEGCGRESEEGGGYRTARTPHSSNDSVSTASTAGSERGERSVPPLASPTTTRPSLQLTRPSPHSYSTPHTPARLPSISRSATSPERPDWREYDSETSAEEMGTEGELSEYSEDEHRREVTPSTSFAATVTSKRTASAPQGRWTGSQVSFASSASAFGLAANEEGEVARRKRKLKKRPPGSEAASGLEDDSPPSPMKQPLLSSRTSFTIENSRSSVTSPAASVYTYRAREMGSATKEKEGMAFAQDSGDEGRRRRRSATAGSAPAKTETTPGDVVEVEADWLGVVSFSTPPPPLPPTPSKQSATSRLLRRNSTKTPATKSHPPVTARTQAAAQTTKHPLSLSSMLSRSAASLPLGPRRAPSPAPSNTSGRDPPPRPPSASSIRQPATPPLSRKKLHRHSSSATELVPKPRVESFLARARALSKSSKQPITPSPPAAIPPTPPMPRQVSHEHLNLPPPKRSGGLYEGWKMPRPNSTASNLSSGSTTSTLRPIGGSTAPLAAGWNPSTSRGVLPVVTTNRTASPAPTTRQQQGHRPSLSLSSAPDRGSRGTRAGSPARPRTVMTVDRPASYVFEEGGGHEVVRRNSLSDLRIPSRITSSQVRIEEDLERVKEFAKGIDGAFLRALAVLSAQLIKVTRVDLKALRRQYQQLIRVHVSPASSPEADNNPFAGPPPEAVQKITQAIKCLEIDFSSWWEQAEALVDLGDGKTRAEPRESPGVIASKRDRCVSLATQSQTKGRAPDSETETEDTSRLGSVRRKVKRSPSASSIETGLSVEDRQKEMLRGVLAPSHKGASLPSRKPPSPRPSLAVLADLRTRSDPIPSPPSPTLAKPTILPSHAPPPRPNSAVRRVSRAGVSGIKDFLLRLKVKASEEQARRQNFSLAPQDSGLPDDPLSRRSVSNPSRAATPATRRSPAVEKVVRKSRSSSEEDEDWDRASSPETSPLRVGEVEPPTTPIRSSMAVRRNRTQSTKVSGEAGGERMVLTTEAMPSLLLKVREVHERCEECIARLRGVTV